MNCSDQIRANTEIYVKTRKEKKHGANNSEKITVVTAWSHAFSGIDWLSPLLLEGLFIQVGVCWIRLQSFRLSEQLSYLNCLSWRWLKPNILIWIGRVCICLYSVESIKLPMWLIRSLAVIARFKWRFGLEIGVLITNSISILWPLEQLRV